MHKKKIIIGAIIAAILLFVIIMMFSSDIVKQIQNKDKMRDSKYNKVLVIGIDGTDPRIIDQMIKEGKLPNFKKITGQGSYSRLKVFVPAQSPVAWTTIATGVNPGKHGIFDFIIRNPENYLPMLSVAKPEQSAFGTVYTNPVKAKTFFKITSENNIPTSVIKWPMTFPAEEIEGNMLAGLGVPDIKGMLGSYSFYTTQESDRNGEGADKVIEVETNNNIINTQISGPRKMKSGKAVEVYEPMQITVKENAAVIKIQGKEYQIKEGEWGEWIEIKFNVGMFNNINGITRAYLHSADPFRMYLATVQIDPKNPVQQISYPRRFSADLAKDIGLYYTLGLPEDTTALNEGKLDDKSFLQQCSQIEDERAKMFWHEFDDFKKEENGLLAFVFDTSDRVEHMYWEDSGLKSNKTIIISNEIEDYFIEKDKFLGEVMDKIDSNTALMIVSDHGFTSFERSVNLNSWLVENGYMVLDAKPDDKNSGELFSLVDWEKTKAYSLGFGSIYINLKGREGKGIVDPKEKDQLEDEIKSKLKKLKDPENGKLAVTESYKSSETYHGEYAADAPDLVVGFSQGYRAGWQNAVGGVTPKIFADNEKHWKGDHIVDPSHVPGIIITNFKLNTNDTSQLDVAPTILSILGIEVPADMDGKSLV